MTTQTISLYCPDCDDKTTFKRSLQSALGYACNSCGYFVLDEAISCEPLAISEDEIIRQRIRWGAAQRWDLDVAINGAVYDDRFDNDVNWYFVHPYTQVEYGVTFPEEEKVTFWDFH
jgi:DNA-directed RNA polymerase subunit RPC12/RpoP